MRIYNLLKLKLQEVDGMIYLENGLRRVTTIIRTQHLLNQLFRQLKDVGY